LYSTYLTYRTIKKAGTALFIIALSISGLYLLSEILFFLLIDYPFNYYEPEVAIEAWQLSQGEAIYNDPTTGPPAGLYAPLFQFIGALLFQVAPDTLITLRMISLVSLIGIAWMGWKISGYNSTCQLLFLALLVFMWHPNVAFFDLQAKPDSLALFWVFASLFLAFRWVQTDRLLFGICTSLALILAFFTKQTMLFVLGALVLALLFHQNYRKVLMLLLLSTVWGVVGWFSFSYLAGDYMYFYLFTLPSTFDISFGRLANSFYALLSNPWFLLTIYLMGRRLVKQRWHFHDTLWFFALMLSLFISALTAAKAGGMSNAYLPFYLLASVYAGMQLPIDLFLRNMYSKMKAAPGLITLTFLIPVLLISTISFNPAQYISRIDNRLQANKKYEKLADNLISAEGTVYSPFDNYLGIKINQPVFWSYKSERDLFYSNKKPQEGYIKRTLEYDHVITVAIGSYFSPKRLESVLQEHNYSYFKSYQIDQDIVYRWWKKSDP